MKELFLAKKNKRNSGFSLVELVVAIGILAVISTIVAFMMTSSSKNYGRMSVETQLQSEAQLVANAISEYAIDSYDAKNQCSVSINSIYDNTENKVLVLYSKERNGVEYNYVITRTAENKLYLGERSKNPGDAWSGFTFSLLGNYITDFTVDTSHVDKENIINFQLTYTKNKRTYNGNYQVLMRNRAYADKDTKNNNNNDSMKLILGLQPKQIYVDIIGGAPGNNYYYNEISDGGKRTLTSSGIELTSSVTSNKILTDNKVEWYLNGADENGFDLPEADLDASGNKQLSEKAYLKIVDGYNFDNSAIDDFTISVAKSVLDAEGNTVSASSKQTKVHLRRVKSIRLIAVSGSTAWKSIYDSYNGNPIKSDEVDSYAYPDAYGNYYTMVFNANIIQKWVPYAGGLTWKLEMKDKNSNDWVTPAASYARLQYNETDSSTTNSVIFGNSVMNGQIYKITATSKFDGSKLGEYTFGIAPRERENGGGYHGRGFYVNLNDYLKDTDFPIDTTGENGLADNKIFKDQNALSIDITADAKIEAYDKYQDAGGSCYYFIDYASSTYNQKQRFDFYSQNMVSTLDAQIAGDVVKGIKYDTRPVFVHKVAPSSDVLVITRGKSSDVKVKTDYYNIINSDYFGIYIDNDSLAGTQDFSGNLNNANSDSNPFLKVEYASSYGDAKHFVDIARITLTAKDSQVYNANPITVRFTADDYYKLCFMPDEAGAKYKYSDYITNSIAVSGSYGWTGYTRSATDYTVYIANVVGQNVFISGPSTTVGTCKFPLEDVKKATSSKPKSIGGYDSDGKYISNIAKAYMNGSKYMCEYNGNTYTYNQTYHYWSN
ncbi:MAG: type II secretion system protein [Lachnospiraceae bacterium]|nr:type II secretion system protein [Lachnospiraceae bacterium]